MTETSQKKTYTRKKIQRHCKRCGQAYHTEHKSQLFCSMSCYGESQRKEVVIYRICKHCQNEFVCMPANKYYEALPRYINELNGDKDAQYCSHTCAVYARTDGNIEQTILRRELKEFAAANPVRKHHCRQCGSVFTRKGIERRCLKCEAMISQKSIEALQ